MANQFKERRKVEDASTQNIGKKEKKWKENRQIFTFYLTDLPSDYILILVEHLLLVIIFLLPLSFFATLFKI